MEVRIRGNAFDRHDRWREISLSPTVVHAQASILRVGLDASTNVTPRQWATYDVWGTTFMLWNMQAGSGKD